MDSRTLSLLLNTFYLAAATCAVSVPLGIVFAGLLWRTDFPGRNFWRAVLTAMLFVPLYLQAAAWQAGFGLQGWWTAITHWPPLVDDWRGAIWIHAMAALPWVVLIVGLGLRRSERDLEETALLDASPGKVFFRVTLKNALPAVGAAVLWVAVTTAGEMTVTDFFAIRTYAEELYTQIAIGQEPGVPVASILLGVALTVFVILSGIQLLNHFIPRERSLGIAPSLTFQLGRWRKPAAGLATLFLLLLIGVPLFSLFYKAGVQVDQTETRWIRSFSIVKCLSMIFRSPKYFSREFGWSISIGALSAAIAVILASVFAWWGRSSKNARRTFQFAYFCVIAFVFSLPGPLLGLGVIYLLNRPEAPTLYWLYNRSILAPTLVLILKCLPAASLVIWYAIYSLPRDVLESAAVDGAGSWTQFYRIALPMRWRAVLAAWIVALAVSLGDLAASILVCPPDVRLFSISIFNLIHYGVDDKVAGLCLMLLMIFTSLVSIALYGARRPVKSP
ncbi:MAG: iron ABC transporter permease [Pirellulales bacterium]|nr:iron ABC transporter permease [Pirellulales bacterium]